MLAFIALISGLSVFDWNQIKVGAATEGPNDPLYLASEGNWGLNGSHGIHASEAWKITTGSRSVRVGIIDTGIADHPDLRENVVQGYDFYNNNSETSDDESGHGTGVSGIIGAVGNNNIGTVGVNWNVSMVPLQTAKSIVDKNGKETVVSDTSSAIKAIKWATQKWGTDEQVDILNYSVDGFGVRAEVRDAMRDFPGLVIWSAGNENKNIDDFANFESFNMPNVISVGAINSRGQKWSSSNYGQKAVDIYAPGEYIHSTVPTWVLPEGYGIDSGTSLAAPHVTGVAALMLSVRPEMNAAQLKEAILRTADNITINVANGTQSVRKLNAYEAVNLANQKYAYLFGGGGGTETDPFQIYNDSHLRNMDLAVKGFYVTHSGYVQKIGFWFKLMNDITVSGNWKTFQHHFSGSFDGNGHYITFNMEIAKTDLKLDEYGYVQNKNFGFFSFVDESAIIKNLTLKNCTIKSSENITCDNILDVGILAGAIYSKRIISNVIIENPNIAINIKTAYVGGLAGSIDKYLFDINCQVIGGQVANTKGITGGIAGIGNEGGFDNKSKSSTTVVKYGYQSGDKIGKVVGNSEETGNVDVTGAQIVKKKQCVAEGTFITLADGRQIPVEDLTGNEMLLVWNLYTGTFDAAPILIIDKDEDSECLVVKLEFADGIQVKVIGEHGFWDCDLNRYVYLDESNAFNYIGHRFNQQKIDDNGNLIFDEVKLLNVSLEKETFKAYSPVTYGHLCYYVNGMLSMPGGIEGLFNIFNVDGETMQYDATKMQSDIDTYGLFTYEEFNGIIPVSQMLFDAVQGQYLKVAIGKGLINCNDLAQLIKIYSSLWE